MFLHVTRAVYVSEYKLWLEFNDGSKGEVDLSGVLSGAIFEPLKDPSFFRSFVLDDVLATVVWPNGADFAPEYLRDLLQEKTVAA